MTRTDYLTQLETYLHKLPEADRIEAMDYFKELFDDAGPEGEEELIASLGTPKEAAHDVGIPVGIAIILTIIGLFIAATSVILAFFTVSVTGILLGGLFIVESFSVLVEAKSAFILIFGAGLLAIGASSLVLLGISYVARFFGLLIVRLVQWILKKGKRGDRHA